MKRSVVLTIIFGLILIAAAAALGLMIKEKREGEKVAAKPTQAQVEITKDGFSPATISVNKGATITWTNKDTAPHWVASDPHPTHTGLAGFDSGENTSQGETYSFTFEKSGTFTYHDEPNPLKFQGTVIVK
ncbi:MAG TPA: cupredoxin domain-containing protein [Candidatus Nanoarchaeia archaeon]